MEFHHVAQAGLELLCSNDDPSALASQSAGITGIATVPGINLFYYIWSSFGSIMIFIMYKLMLNAFVVCTNYIIFKHITIKLFIGVSRQTSLRSL